MRNMGDLNKKLYFRKTKKFLFLLFPYTTKIYMCDSDCVIKMESMKCPLPIAPIVLLGPSKPHSRNFFFRKRNYSSWSSWICGSNPFQIQMKQLYFVFFQIIPKLSVIQLFWWLMCQTAQSCVTVFTSNHIWDSLLADTAWKYLK